MQIQLHKFEGKQADITATVRRADAAQLEVFFAFQARVREAMPNKALYIPSEKEELRGDMQNHLVIGVWVAETLIAYATLRYCGVDAHNYANYLDVPKEDLPYWANMDSVVVAPEYRGNALQQRLFMWCIAWRRPEIVGVGCTVSPDNTHSLENAKACGYEVYARRMMYGNHDRFVLKKHLAPLCGEYVHFKGGRYRVLCVAKHSETLAEMVVYQALYGEGGTWVRPVEMWFEHVDKGDYHGTRFRYVAP